MEKYLAIWNSLEPDKETSEYVYQEGDLFTIIDSYIFIVQKNNDCNNIIFKKFRPSTRTLRSVLTEFRDWLIESKIDYIRIEGTTARYLFLPKMFPGSSFIKDETIKDRNVYYVKLTN